MVIKYVVTDSKGGFCLTDNVKTGIRIKDIFFLGFLAAMAPLSTDMYLPGLPQMTTEMGVGASLIQLTLTMSMAGMAIGQLLAGPVSDHFGRKYPSAAGMAVFMLSSLGCAMAPDIIALLVMRLIQGLYHPALFSVPHPRICPTFPFLKRLQNSDLQKRLPATTSGPSLEAKQPHKSVKRYD